MNFSHSGDLLILNALVFDGNSPELTETSIRIVNGNIVEIGGSSTGDKTFDARGRFVMPGLIDAHFHAYGISLNGLYNDTAPLSYVALVGSRRLEAALARGFTTVRDVAGGDNGLATAVRQQLISSPRYYYTGPALSQTGGHGDPRTTDMLIDFACGHSNDIVDGIDGLRRAVRERFRLGAHAVKIMASGGVISPVDPIRIPQYSPEEIRAVVDEAARRGSYVAAHAYSSEAIQHAVVNGVRSIEHGNLMNEETAVLMSVHSAYLVPTLITYDAMSRRGKDMNMTPVALEKNSSVLDSGKTAIERAAAAGVPVGYGSDLLGDLEVDQLLGIRLQMEVLGTLETLRSVTSVNASLLQKETLGRIAVGAAGDVLILEGNPFENPHCLWDIDAARTVVQAGRIVA